MTLVGQPGTRRSSRQREALGRDFGILTAIDDAADAWSERLRGARWADTGAAVLSNLSDHGVIWVLIAGAKARRPGPGRRRALSTLACAGVASFSVNRAVKRVVGRARPDVARAAGPSGPLPVRRPSSSSFPSGHTLAAFCTAIALGDGPSETGAMLGFATAVAASRVHLRAHHLSDVLGGAVVGATTGIVVRAALRPLLGPPLTPAAGRSGKTEPEYARSRGR